MDTRIAFPAMVKEYRLANGLTMEQLAEKIGKTKSTISKWESGSRSPKIYEIEEIAEFFGVEPEIMMFGKSSVTPEVVVLDHNLDKDRKSSWISHGEQLLDQQESEKARQKLQQAQNEGQKPKVGENTSLINLDEKRAEYEARKTVPKSINSEVSAGTGVVGMDLDEEHSFYLDSIPDDYDYIVKVKGDSMRPVMADGDFLFVKETPQVDTNAIGIFQINGENYVKKLRLTPNYIYYLESINPDYDDIYFHEDDTIRTIGEVVDVYREG